MTPMITSGAAIALAGTGGILWCVLAVAKARRAGLDEAAMRVKLSQIVVWNYAALLLSALGLIVVVVGLILG